MTSVALALVLATAPQVLVSSDPAPTKSADVVWVHNGTDTHGFWLPDAEVIQAAQRIKSCEQKEIDRVAAPAPSSSWWITVPLAIASIVATAIVASKVRR